MSTIGNQMTLKNEGENMYMLQALSNNVILRRVFSFLEFSSLKISRQVSKKWFYESQVYFKEGSSIKIRYDRKEPVHIRDNVKTVEEFLSTFNDAPLKRTFSGITFQFFVCGHSFQWTNEPLTNFLRVYGLQITFLRLNIFELLYGETKKFDLFLFKRTLAEFLPNLAYLHINFCGRHLPENIPIIGGMKEALGPGILPMLRKLEWKWEVIPPDPYSHHVSTLLLADLLNSSPKLNSLTIKGTMFSPGAYDSLKAERISMLKEISFFPHAGSDISVFCNKMIELAKKKLRLSSLNVSLQDSEEQWKTKEQYFISWLIKFLSTQKDGLKELRVSLPLYDSSTDYHFFPFPKMNKLNLLELRTSVRFPDILFRNAGDNWGALFPRLENLALSCTYVVSQDSELYFPPKVVCVPNFLFKFGSQNSGNVKSVMLNTCYDRKLVQDYDFYGQQCSNDMAVKCYEQVKQFFANMITFQIYEVRDWRVYAFNGSKENFVSFSYS